MREEHASTQSKPRGRPIADPAPDPNLQRRRDRIRKNQRAFRERKLQVEDELRSRVAALESTVEKMSLTVGNFGHAILRSRDLAPHHTQQVVDLMNQFVAFARESETGHLDRVIPPSDEPNSDNDDPPLYDLPMQDFNFLPQVPDVMAGGALAFGAFPTAQTERRPLPDIAKYLAAGPNAFPTRLYRHSMQAAMRTLRNDDLRDPNYRGYFEFTLRYVSAEVIMDAIGERLERILSASGGSSGQNTPPPDIDQPQCFELANVVDWALVRGLIIDGLDERDRENYLDAWEVQEYLWGVYGVDVGLVGYAQMEIMLERLTARAKCLGQGPRYHRGDVDGVAVFARTGLWN